MPTEQANLKRYRAKKDRDQRLHHSKEYYQMLDYSLFITTENEQVFTAKQIAQLYGWRWRIETIFKCWKSHFHLQTLIPQDRSITKARVLTIIYMVLIFIVIFQVYIYQCVMQQADQQSCSISLSKFCKYIANFVHFFFEETLNSLIPEILYHCRYDKRNDRKNFVQKIKLS
jgi:hypothetical protein